jgi:undecaprenyl-diphosphatase
MTRPVLLWWGSGAIVAAVLLGVVITGAGPAAPLIDTGWNALMAGIRTPELIGFAEALDHIGGGWVASYLVPLVIIAALLLTRRWRAAIFAAAVMLVSVAAVQLLKSLYARGRPEDMLVTSDFGSFPSGHTANAATLAALAILLFPRVWVVVIAVAWTLAMAFSRTVVAAHWLSDTVGGMLVGAGVAMVMGGFLLTWARSLGAEPDLPRIPEERP